jgi:hypothetical protein
MDIHDLTRRLKEKSHSKIVFLVADGLGGLPMEAGGETELETAHHPNLDDLAAKGVLGLVHPVLPGITPGSGSRNSTRPSPGSPRSARRSWSSRPITAPRPDSKATAGTRCLSSWQATPVGPIRAEPLPKMRPSWGALASLKPNT